MKLVTGVIAGAVITMAGGAVTAYAIKHREPGYAQVVDVKPVQRTIRTPRQECHDEAVTPKGPTKDSKRPVIGAVIGGVVGRTVPTTEKRCTTVYDTHIERNGYEVRYRIGEREGTVRMDHDPGDRIPLRQGQLVLDAHTVAG